MSSYTAMYRTLFGVRKSVRYHQRRRSFFETMHTVSSALQVIAGSSAFAVLVGGISTEVAAALTAAVALLAALDLTIGTTRRATLHAGLAQQFAQLEREMVPREGDTDVDAATADAFRQRRLEIEEAEPPKLRVIDILCHNELVTSTYTHWKVYPVGCVRYVVGHVLDIEVAKILEHPKDVPTLTGSA